MKINRFIEFALDVLYPPKCGFCGKLNEKYLCKRCEKNLLNKYRIECLMYEEIIKSSALEAAFFEELIYIFRYESEVRQKIITYKFRGCSYLYKSFVTFLLKDKKIVEKIKKYDTIIPVPISYKRYKKRGYNQSGLIAKEISKQLCVNYNDRVLVKTKDIIAQSKLNKEERINNVKNVYKIVGEADDIQNKRILVVDDIFTTGNTVNEICREIRKSNPERISVLVIAKD